MSDLIITPNEKAKIYKFNKADGSPVFVAECPGCRFNHVPICLATGSQLEIPKIVHLAEKEFPKLWRKMADKMNAV
jgi:hypothetical protein